MNTERPHPPAVAMWLLQHLCPRRHREAIIGDLWERFHAGRSNCWLWRQVLVAILVGAVSQERLRWPEVCFAAAGTALISCIPWGLVLPIGAMTTSMSGGAQWQWLVVIEIVTALLVLPLFALFLWTTLSWAKLLRVFILCALLFTAGDLLLTWWCASHLVMSQSQAKWAVMLQLGWIFVALLISARLTRQWPSKTIPT